MKKTIRLTENELINLVNRIIVEQTNARPATDADVKFVTKTIGSGELFPTGKSEVNTGSEAFKNLSKSLVTSVMDDRIQKPLEIKVQGGASAVGSPGFDNLKLANDRRNEMIRVLTQKLTNDLTNKVGTTSGMGFKQDDYFKFTPLKSVVGKATVKDSPEAKAEQFVKVSYPTMAMAGTDGTTAIDKTATRIPTRDTTKGEAGKTVPVKIFRDADGKVVPMNSKTMTDINSVLQKYGMSLNDIHGKSGV